MKINDEFICPIINGFKRYAYRHDKYGYKRDFKLYECDDCSECPLKNQCMNFNSKQTKIMKNYNWEYFKSQINKKLSEPETKISTVKEKLMWNLFWIWVSLGCLSEDSIKRELGFVLMALNIRKVVAQRAENNQKFIKRQFLYYFNRNCLFSLSRTLCPGLLAC